jgi:hypothetical protein
MGLESVFPGEELFFRQLVDLASFLDGDLTASHCDDDRGLTTYYPSAGVRRWQTFSKQRFDQGITERRFHERHGDGDGPTGTVNLAGWLRLRGRARVINRVG